MKSVYLITQCIVSGQFISIEAVQALKNISTLKCDAIPILYLSDIDIRSMDNNG